LERCRISATAVARCRISAPDLLRARQYRIDQAQHRNDENDAELPGDPCHISPPEQPHGDRKGVAGLPKRARYLPRLSLFCGMKDPQESSGAVLSHFASAAAGRSVIPGLAILLCNRF